jgi:hypothetical protein
VSAAAAAEKKEQVESVQWKNERRRGGGGKDSGLDGGVKVKGARRAGQTTNDGGHTGRWQFVPERHSRCKAGQNQSRTAKDSSISRQAQSTTGAVKRKQGKLAAGGGELDAGDGLFWALSSNTRPKER